MRFYFCEVTEVIFHLSCLTLSYHPESKVIKYLDWCNFDVLELIIPSAPRSK